MLIWFGWHNQHLPYNTQTRNQKEGLDMFFEIIVI